MTSLRAPVRLLLTGFGPFPGVADNASAALVTQLADLAGNLSGVRVASQILAVDWEAAPREAAALIAAESPDIILHFGVTRSATGLIIETMAHNRCGDFKDARGVAPASSRLCTEAADTLPSTFPAQEIVLRLREKNLPVQLSEDAGAYLCNAVLYTTLQTCTGTQVQAGFIHLPVDLSGSDGGLSMSDAVDGALEIVRTCIEALQSR